jgi:hypothetical protein
LFATAADAFMDLVSSCVMLVTSRLASRPSIYKYPVGRTRIETIGIIMFCCLMTTVAIQLIVRPARALLMPRSCICVNPSLIYFRLNLGVVWLVVKLTPKNCTSFPLFLSLSQVCALLVARQSYTCAHPSSLLQGKFMCVLLHVPSISVRPCLLHRP